MNKKTNPVDIKRIQTINTMQNFRIKALSHSAKQKQESVLKDNNKIFQKLLSVNNRKNTTLGNLNTTRSFSHKNLTNLKKTINEISHENNMLAEKLVTVKSQLSQSKLMSNYSKHLQIKERLKKYEYDEEYGVVAKKLKSLEKLQRLKWNQSQKYYYQGSSSRISGGSSLRYENQEQAR